MTVAALTGKVKFTNAGKTEYRVETLLGGSKSGWKQHFKTLADAQTYINKERNDFVGDTKFLVTEVSTRTIGMF